ncbi:Tetraspanin-7 [Acipenser ruthenus]|uniref:Tetraspanin-7 n=1 Tax=Acipenser ruthenus TaxID=7906 RepID=A0A444UTD8_ACIRT|nr:Tetraspanin-7 [Acipenser ruthenus]
MTSQLPYDTLPRLSLVSRQESLELTGSAERLARRLSSPRGLAAGFGKPYSTPNDPRRSSATPGLGVCELPPYSTSSQCLAEPEDQPSHREEPPALDWSSCRYRPMVRARRGTMALLKLALMAFSFLFWVAGLAMFTVGIWAKISLSDYLVLSTNRYPNTAFILLASGAAVIAWGFLGCFSAATENRCLLRTYGLFQVALLGAGLFAGLSGLFYRKDIAEGFQNGLREAVRSYGEDEVKADALDALQRVLECCGVQSYRDWLSSSWSLEPNGSVPASCCVLRRGCRNSPLPPEGGGAAGIYTHGCFQKVHDFVNDNMFYIAAGALGLAAMQAVGIGLACLLAARIPGAELAEGPRGPPH